MIKRVLYFRKIYYFKLYYKICISGKSKTFHHQMCLSVLFRGQGILIKREYKGLYGRFQWARPRSGLYKLYPQSTGFKFSHMLYLETVDIKKKTHLSTITLHYGRRYILIGEKICYFTHTVGKEKNYIFLSMGPSCTED